MNHILKKISEDGIMAQMWEQFRKKNYFVGELQWEEVSEKVIRSMVFMSCQTGQGQN